MPMESRLPIQPSEENHATNEPAVKQTIPFWRVVLSVMQASFGVQNRTNRERDFASGKFLPFVVAALLFTALFVLSIALVVRLVLPE
jgi:hypothetical protein